MSKNLMSCVINEQQYKERSPADAGRFKGARHQRNYRPQDSIQTLLKSTEPVSTEDQRLYVLASAIYISISYMRLHGTTFVKCFVWL